MIMKDQDIAEKIAAYLSGDLSKHEVYEVETLISENQKWKNEHEDQEKLLTLMDSVSCLEPPARMKNDFEKMLLKENQRPEPLKRVRYWNSSKLWWQVAASLAILALGYFIGISIHKNTTNDQILALQKEMNATKQMVITSLKAESASARLKAVNTSNEMKMMDEDILIALINTLNTDKNVNVRIASLEALSQFADQEHVRKALIESLSTQNEPTIQIVLIHLLVQLNEKRALAPLEKMMNDKNTMETVRDEASFGVFKLS